VNFIAQAKIDSNTNFGPALRRFLCQVKVTVMSKNRKIHTAEWETGDGAGNGIRTRDLDLGKVALYQLSYSRSLKNQTTEA
jgi:hypothetical protein